MASKLKTWSFLSSGDGGILRKKIHCGIWWCEAFMERICSAGKDGKSLRSPWVESGSFGQIQIGKWKPNHI